MVNANTIWNAGITLAATLVMVLSVIMGLDARNSFSGPAPVVETYPEFVAHVSEEVVEKWTTDEFEPEFVEETEVGQSRTSKRAPKYKSAVLQVVANFQKSEVTVNGIPYPSYIEPGQPEGVVLPAGGPYDVRVTHQGKTKAYTVYLRPNETRLLIVEIPGFSGSAAPPPVARAAARTPEPEPKSDSADPGKVTVYSKPPGVIIIDGKNMGEKTPGTVDVANGRHEVQVQYDGGEISEKKIVRVRDGSRIKLFFRERTAPP